MLWLGIARSRLNPPDLAGAAEAFDSALSANVTEFNVDDHLPTMAAYWRTWVAKRQDDMVTARAMLIKIRDEMPDGEWRRKALARYGDLLNTSAPE